MLLAAGGDGIGKAGGGRLAQQGDVLHLQQHAPFRPFQQKIDAAVAEGIFGPYGGSGQILNDAGAQAFLHHPVAALGVGIHPESAHLDEFQGIGQLAIRIAAGRHQHPMPGHGALAHAAGVGGMGRHQTAVVQLDIGQKALVTPHQAARQQRLGQFHRPSSAISHSAMPSR